MEQATTETTKRNSAFWETEVKEIADKEPPKILWNKDEYYRLADLGFFNGKRVELIEGEIFVKYSYTKFDEGEYEMSAMSSLHFSGVNVAAEVMREVFKKKYFVSVQCPVDMGENSEPEPDISIIEGKARDFKNAIPKTAALIIEVSDTSLFYDRGKKASLYARAEIEDYWIVNVKDKRLEVYRRPIKDETAFYGFSYGEIRILSKNDEVLPLGAPDAKIKVADILP